MKILVIGGMHGNEPLGLEVCELFTNSPVKNIDVELANLQAIDANVRFTGQDLNRSFPGNIDSSNYELKRAAQLIHLAKKYDLVLDFHNTHCPNNDCGFVGQGASQNLFNSAWLLGLDKIVVADYDCMNKYALNCLSIEVSLNSELNNPKLWYERISALSQTQSLATDPKIQKFRFAYRMTLEDKEKFDLPAQNLKAFEPMSDELALKLGVKSPAYPIFIGDKFTPYNYGGVLNEL